MPQPSIADVRRCRVEADENRGMARPGESIVKQSVGWAGAKCESIAKQSVGGVGEEDRRARWVRLTL